MMAKSRIKIRVFWNDLVWAFWLGFGTCLTLVLLILWAVNRGK